MIKTYLATIAVVSGIFSTSARADTFYFGGKVGYPSLYGVHVGFQLANFSVKAVFEQQFQGIEGSFRLITPSIPGIPVIYSNEFGMGLGIMSANSGVRPNWLDNNIDLWLLRLSGQWNIRLSGFKPIEFFIKYGFDVPIDSKFYDSMPRSTTTTPIAVLLWSLRLNFGINIYLF